MSYAVQRKKWIRGLTFLYYVTNISILLVISNIATELIYQAVIKFPNFSAGFNFIKSLFTAFEIDSSPLLIIISGAFYSYKTSDKIIKKIYSRFFDAFNDNLFHPIGTAKSFDALWGGTTGEENPPVMPFLRSEGTPWHNAWNQLCELFPSETIAQTHEKKSDPKTFPLFSWGILAGPSGSGKSRLAVEFARWLRRETCYNDATKERTYVPSKFATWYRVQFWRKPCGPDDSWDTGWLRRVEVKKADKSDGIPIGFKDHDCRTKINSLQLATWRPRRPTFILLDDPFIGDSSKVIEELSNNSVEYKHPVVLLIVSHSIPEDLNLVRKNNGEWDRGGLANMGIDPIDMGGKQCFSDNDICKAAGKMLPVAVRLSTNIMLNPQPFVKKTTGLPFLVELGFSWLRSGERQIKNMNQDVLLDERVKRIVTAVEQCGLSKQFLEVMALATIAGSRQSISIENIPTELKGDLDSGYMFTTEITEFLKLSKLFPFLEDNIKETIPAVRPMIVGEAFVRKIFTNPDMMGKNRATLNTIAKKIVAVAWKINSEETLRFSRHLGFIKGDPLYSLFKSPPEGLFSTGYLFQVYAKSAILLPVAAQPGTTRYKQAEEMMLTAYGYIADLTDGEIEKNINFLFSLQRKNADYQWISFNSLSILMKTLIAHYIKSQCYSSEIFSQYITELWKIAQNRIGIYKSISTDIDTGISQAFTSCTIEKLLQIFSIVSCAWRKYGWCEEIGAWISGAITSDDILKQLVDKSFNDSIIIPHNLIGDSISKNKNAKMLRNYVLYKVSGHENNYDIISVFSCIISTAARLADVDESKTLCSQLKKFVDNFPQNNIIFQCCLARSWSNLCFHLSCTGDRAECKNYVAKIRTVIDTFPVGCSPFANIHMVYAIYYYASVLSTTNDDSEFEELISTARVIAKRFSNYSTHFQLSMSEILFLHCTIQSNMDSLDECTESIAEAKTIIDEFPESVEMQKVLASMFANFSTLAARKMDVEKCELAISAIKGIADNFRENVDIHDSLAQVWGEYSNIAAENKNIVLCEDCIQSLEDILIKFPSSEIISLYLAFTLCNYSWIFSCKKNIPFVHDVAMRVDNIGDKFPNICSIQHKRATAWRYVSFASYHSGNTELYKTAIDVVADIAAKFPQDTNIQNQLEIAFRDTTSKNSTHDENLVLSRVVMSERE